MSYPISMPRNYIPHPRIKKTPEEKKAVKKAWAKANSEKEKAYAKKSREKHKEQRRLDTKKWIEKNKEYSKQYHKEYHKRWYQDNKEVRDKENLEWSKNNPEKVRQIKEKFNNSHENEIKNYLTTYQKTLKGKYRTLKGSACKRKYSVEIDFDEFCSIVSKCCIYCGEDEQRIGIDRIDNKIGYTLENSAPCCNPCNMMKKTMSVETFLSHISKIYKHNNV